ncbi:low temperature requirement protein LtrA [Asanoa ferruginea]|uniref:Low temperature requirement protein LtrA n=1 Tax=Asanoa ferruginea TaxID=53367 RepID=A0A3D9ZF08_9ACTN|nr:low temperature requirement protein A [Asanoa ferruginea]REF96008.1 low temperature requirement protein LtrA [Asanoa ferruginea]GIF48131.1 low temperature requirement protein A [Asanoa ferruginea]
MTDPTPVEPAVRVTTLELFFDLVFVFTITQLTDALAEHLGWSTFGETVLMLGIIWWMYSGYAWLTNAVAPTSTFRRSMLLVGMAGFLIIALSIPEAFGDNGWAFGAGFMVVSVAHSVLFLRSAGLDAFRAATGFAPLNLIAAGLVLAGGLLPEEHRAAWWGGALVVQSIVPYLRRIGGLALIAGHFVERHGLVMIIVIGESIVSIGLGFVGVELDGSSLLVALLGLGVAYYFYWAYFAGDDERSAEALRRIADPVHKARVAVWGWGYAHFPMIIGIVLFSAGIKKAIPAAFDPLKWNAAVALAVGAAAFMIGHAVFLTLLRLWRGVAHRLIAAALVVLTIFIGHIDATAQLVAILAIMAGALILEDLPQVIRSRSTNLHTFGR